MALRSPTVCHSYWGAYPTVSLPTSSDVEVGDTAYDTTVGQLVACAAAGPVVWSSVGGSGSPSIPATQPNTFADGQAVYFDGTNWLAAQSDAIGTLGLGIVTNVTPTDFTVIFSGPITLPGLYPLEGGPGALVPGQYYFVSASAAGTLTATQPSGLTEFSNPIIFAISPTEAVVLPFRPSAVASSGGGGPAPAIDANHIYVWACDDPVGSLSLANTGSIAGGAAIINGTVSLESKRMTRDGNSALFVASSSTPQNRAAPAGISVLSANGLSVEAFVALDNAPSTDSPGAAVAFSMVRGSQIIPNHQDYMAIGMVVVSGVPRWITSIRKGSDPEVFLSGSPIGYGSRAYLLSTYNPTTSTIILYVNGQEVGRSSVPIAWGNLNEIQNAIIGNLAWWQAGWGGPAVPFSGSIMQVRVSNVVRSAAYAIATAETLFAM